MPFLVPIFSLLTAASIMFAFTVNRRAGAARTVLCVIFPLVFVLFASDNWRGWHAASGNQALQYEIAFVLSCVTLAALLIALGRRIAWLRHHKHDGWAS